MVSAVTLFSGQITEVLGRTENFEATNLPMILGAALGLATGLYSFFLPNTPPKKTEEKITVGDVLGFRALVLFKDRNFAVFAFCSFLIMLAGVFYWIFCNGYLNELGMPEAQFKQSYGQMTELVFLLFMPFFFARFGVKKMLVVGFLAWIARFICFSFGDLGGRVSLIYLGLLLHGVCFDFFFVTGQLYTDKKAPKEVQASAQGLISLLTFGLGWYVGAWLSGWTVETYAVKEIVDGVQKTVSHSWPTIWLYPAAIAFGIMIAFILFFNDDVIVGGKKRDMAAKTTAD